MSLESRIRVGLIGCGSIAYWQHLRNLQQLGGLHISGLADPDPAALERAAGRVEAPCFRSPGELLDRDDIDAVVIASPTGLHADQARAAWHAGKHVYVEKPLAHDAPSLRAVLESVQGTGPVFAVGHNYRFHPVCLRLRELIQSGSIGTVRAVFSHFAESVDPGAWPEWHRSRELGGGALLDLGTHHIDLYRWLLRDELSGLRVEQRAPDSSRNQTILHSVTRDGVAVVGYFAHGVSRSQALTIHGTAGILQIDLHSGRFVVQRDRRRGYGVRTRPVVMGLAWRGRRWIQPSFDPSHGLAMRAFIDAIGNPEHRDANLAGVADGAAAVQAVLDAEAAGR